MKTEFLKTLEKFADTSVRELVLLVKDAYSDKKYLCRKTHREVVQEFGSVEAFFNGLHAQGVKKVRLLLMRKNGTGWLREPEQDWVEHEFIDKKSESPSVAQSREATAAPALSDVSYPPFCPPAGLNGLNVTPDKLGLYYQMDYPRVKAELDQKTAELERLKDENRKLETKILVNDTLEGKSVARTEANAKLLEQATPLLGVIMEKIGGAGKQPVAGLQGAELSPAKQRFLQTAQNLDDTTAYYLTEFLLLTENENSESWDDLLNLFKKHNLIKDA